MKIWSAYQFAIFRDIAEGKGHTVCLARAGAAKTTTLIEGLNHIPENCSVLLAAFNKRIAEELKTRVPKRSGLDVSTLHSYGFRQLQRGVGKLKVESYRVDIYARELLGGETKTLEIRKNLAKTVSLAKSALCLSFNAIDTLIDEFGIETGETNEQRAVFIANVQKLLERCKDVSDGTCDFDDMIWLPLILNLRTWQFDRVLGDEVQDWNAAQIELALRACKPSGRILACGDDRQACYSFRGAGKDSIGDLTKRLKAKVMPLTVTYRCPRAIVRLANEIVPDLEAAPDAPEGEVIRGVTEEAMLRDVRPGDFILSRTNAPLVGFCLQLLRENRPASIQGKDIGASLKHFIEKFRTASEDVTEFRTYIDRWREKECKRLMEKTPPRERAAEEVSDRADTLLALSDGAQSLREITARIEALFSAVTDGERIVLSTTHAAKGLERDRVFMLESTFKRDKGADEANLFYIAVTRAKRVLFMVRLAKKTRRAEGDS